MSARTKKNTFYAFLIAAGALSLYAGKKVDDRRWIAETHGFETTHIPSEEETQPFIIGGLISMWTGLYLWNRKQH